MVICNYVLYVKSLDGIIGGVLPLSESWSQVHGSSCQNIVLVYLSIPSHQIFVHMHSFTSTIPWWHPQSNSVTLASSFFDTTIILVPYRAILDWFLVCPVATCQCSIPCLTYSNSSPTADLSLISSMVAFTLFFPQPLLWRIIPR